MNTFDRTAVLSALTLLSASVFAAPVKFADIASGSAWFIHLDADRARTETPLAQGDGPFADKIAAWRERFGAFSAKLGVDPKTQLSGVTLYGAGDAGSPAVLFYHTVSPAKVRASLAAAEGVEQVVVDGVTLAKIRRPASEAGDDLKFPDVYVAVTDGGPIVLTGDATATVAAYRAVGGAGFNPGAEWGGLTAGRTPQVECGVFPSKLKAKPRSGRVKQADSASFVLERSGGTADLHVKATMPDEKSADGAVTLVNFFKGMLGGNASPEGRKVIDAATVAASGPVVSLDYSGPVSDVVAAGKTFASRVKAARDAKGN